MSRKWRKAKAPARAAAPHVPYGPPVATTVKPHRASKDTMKAVGLVAVKVAAPFILAAVFKALSKR